MSDLAGESVEFIKKNVAAALPGYELRQPQLDMTKACARAIEDGGVLLAEAGTGTGKTFAYLVPIILSGRKAIVSTKTINLQEQLVSKDLAFLSGLTEFDYAIAKGRGNYLCLRRFNAFKPLTDKDKEEHDRLTPWMLETATGDKDTLSFKPGIWGRVSSDADACLRAKCHQRNQCFYFRARARFEDVQVVVANHALLSINAMLAEDARILPEADVLVVDEGHGLDKVLSDQVGLNLSERGAENLMNGLLRPDDRGTTRGALSKYPALFQTVESLREEMRLFWGRVRDVYKDKEIVKDAFALTDESEHLCGQIDALIENIKDENMSLFEDDDEEAEFNAALRRLRGFRSQLLAFGEGAEDSVRWTEIADNRTTLRMSPTYPSGFLNDNILPNYRTTIFTSATLSVAGDFGFIRSVLGLEQPSSLSVPSPFNFGDQVKLTVVRGINPKEFGREAKLAEVIIETAGKGDGGVLVLFTSRDTMLKTWDLCVDELSALDLNPMLQGDSLSNNAMLEAMRKSVKGVIFGLDSFWEGVDVPGDALKYLVIAKLPFDVPTEPLTWARTEEIKKRGGDSFNEYMVPRAAVKLRQGTGRLIRSRDDTGEIIICDERIETARYGPVLMKSIRG